LAKCIGFWDDFRSVDTREINVEFDDGAKESYKQLIGRASNFTVIATHGVIVISDRLHEIIIVISKCNIIVINYMKIYNCNQ